MKFQFVALILTAVAGPGFGQSRLATVDIYFNTRDDSVRLLRSGTPWRRASLKRSEFA